MFKYKDYSFKCDIGMMTPQQYIKMIQLLEEYKPKRICELGSGQSTNIFETYCDKSGSVVYSIEHDLHYDRNKCNIILPLIEHSSLTINGRLYDNCVRYDGLEEWLQNQDNFDFVLIDGPNDGIPFNNDNLQYARIQLFDFVNKLNDGAIVLYHDSEREVAQRTLREFESLLNKDYIKEIIKESDKEIIEYNEQILGVCPELTIYKLK